MPHPDHRPNPTFTRHDPAAVEKVLDSVIVPLYEATHADVIDSPFYSAERFAERVRGYLRAPGFDAPPTCHSW